MNQNIQCLIKSLSPEKLQEINQYVVTNMSDEIRQASTHGTLSETMQNDLDNLIIKYLKENYPDDIEHTIKISEVEAREKIENMVTNSILKMKNTPIEEDDHVQPEHNTGRVVNVSSPNVNLERQQSFLMSNSQTENAVTEQISPPGIKGEQQTIEVHHTQAVAVNNVENNPNNQFQILGVNNGYEQLHDSEQRFFGMQYSIYLFLAKFEDDDIESYFKILLVVASIGMILGFWNAFSDISSTNAIQEFYKHKNSVYMLNLADFCQHTMSKVELFQQCVANRQTDLVSDRRASMFKNFLIGLFSLITLFIVYFLKLNYRGRDAYINREN